jgi:hypothetical protein
MEKVMSEKATKKDAGTENKMPKVVWDDSNMKSSYANVCNVSSTREEMTLLFGTNQNWNPGQGSVTVQLSDRIILNPFAAKRLATLLNNVVAEYEKRFGSIGASEQA